ncbi:MAG: hypothetical protein JXB36_00565 [Gammaproteobacteria bacterium]|nr:hypothetical protein [Gammaproteobacteria bacterium]
MKRCIALVALGFSGIALAQGEMPPFEEVDSNQDGQISRVEAAAIEGLDFTTADTNQDGSLDRTEYMSAGGQGQGQPGQSPGQGGEEPIQ